MRDLYAKIQRAVRLGKVVFSLHANNRLRQRRIVRWQVVEGFAQGQLLQTHAAAKPNPKILVRQALPDGTEVIAVWGFVESISCAKLITVYFEEDR